jgi:hypothetical protein
LNFAFAIGTQDKNMSHAGSCSFVVIFNLRF